ncbi:hypothetical protein Pint_19158 [Pistacia integerrima]|uniref:Uncharacterized protein n=1 Tax=Pistacia integerrima TaxID=434235 RepID=A0ACC0YVZ7_9ROSI|nr:hypothetical protein Pint_19158 [Pistacia integerrima]
MEVMCSGGRGIGLGIGGWAAVEGWAVVWVRWRLVGMGSGYGGGGMVADGFMVELGCGLVEVMAYDEVGGGLWCGCDGDGLGSGQGGGGMVADRCMVELGCGLVEVMGYDEADMDSGIVLGIGGRWATVGVGFDLWVLEAIWGGLWCGCDGRNSSWWWWDGGRWGDMEVMCCGGRGIGLGIGVGCGVGAMGVIAHGGGGMVADGCMVEVGVDYGVGGVIAHGGGGMVTDGRKVEVGCSLVEGLAVVSV